ncbi:MAG: hypothetical protein U9N56_01040, partial [Actinomycetota bacterium]|nr:hypothetical protein [Actinomycetota bacterium]
LWAPVHTFLAWALVREIDPDHQSAAIAAGIASGLWILAGLDAVGVLMVGALMVAARLVTNSTGRRPLIPDLTLIGIFATAVSFTTVGWIAGFGLAIAIYIDDRMADGPSVPGSLAAALTALGSTAVASLAGVFPRELPNVRPLLAVAVGVLALITVIREPEAPTEMVDSRSKNFLSQTRLHASRTLIAVLIFAATLLTGQDALMVGPLVIALALALTSNEIERIRRQ